MGLSYQSSLFSKFQASELPYLKKAKWVVLRNANQRWPLVSTYTHRHKHTHTYTHPRKSPVSRTSTKKSIQQFRHLGQNTSSEMNLNQHTAFVWFVVQYWHWTQGLTLSLSTFLPCHTALSGSFSVSQKSQVPRTIRIYSHLIPFLQTFQKACSLEREIQVT